MDEDLDDYEIRATMRPLLLSEVKELLYEIRELRAEKRSRAFDDIKRIQRVVEIEEEC